MKNDGLLLVISGPAGAGKGTVVKQLTEDENIRLSISATTRAPRGTEQDGVEYHFLSREGFEALIAEDGFYEYAQYLGNYYGSPKKPVIEWMKQGCDVILEIEVQGCEKVKQAQPDCVSIFIRPPSMDMCCHIPMDFFGFRTAARLFRRKRRIATKTCGSKTVPRFTSSKVACAGSSRSGVWVSNRLLMFLAVNIVWGNIVYAIRRWRIKGKIGSVCSISLRCLAECGCIP